jgi:hypothetical protein
MYVRYGRMTTFYLARGSPKENSSIVLKLPWGKRKVSVLMMALPSSVSAAVSTLPVGLFGGIIEGGKQPAWSDIAIICSQCNSIEDRPERGYAKYLSY